MAIFFAVVVTYFVCFGVLTHSMIIFGRRKFAVALIIAAILMWSEICVLKMNGIGLEIFEHSSYAGILLLIPGLIANEMERASVSSVTSGMSLCIAWILIVGGLYHETRSFFRPEQVIPLLAAFAGILVVAGVLSKTSGQHRSPARLQSIRE